MCAKGLELVNEYESLLWDRFRHGDRAAHSEIMEKYAQPLFNYGYQICRDREIVKDCIQEVFFELWTRRANISPVSCVRWYLIKSIRTRIFKDQLKWNINEQLNDEYMFTVEFNIESQMIHDTEHREFITKVQDVINLLPPRQREIMYLRFYQDMDFNQIGEIMNINRQSIHNLLQKAYKSFRAEWIIVFLVQILCF